MLRTSLPALFIDTGVVGRLVSLLAHPDPSILTPALRALGNIVTGTDEHTQAVIDKGALPSFIQRNTGPSKKNVKKETCWAISNITAGTVQQLRAVIDAGIIPALVDLLGQAEFEVKKEAAWAIANATKYGNMEQIEMLVTLGCVPPLRQLLEVDAEERVISVASTRSKSSWRRASARLIAPAFPTGSAMLWRSAGASTSSRDSRTTPQIRFMRGRESCSQLTLKWSTNERNR